MKSTPAHRPDTLAAHQTAVEKVIRHMKANLVAWDADLSLEALAREGCYSKSHLIEIFEDVTGTTPHHFLASLRIQKAKELLLHSDASATEISLEVGYQSFSTFSRTFSDYVGLSPLEFRKTPKSINPSQLVASASAFIARNGFPSSCQMIEGCVRVPPHAPGLIFVGTFTRGVPQGRPDSGTVLLHPGVFRIRRPSVPRFHLLAALMSSQIVEISTSCTISPALVASRSIANLEDDTPELILRPMRSTDPPLVVSLVALLE